MQKVKIEGKLPGYNELRRLDRGNPKYANKVLQDYESNVMWQMGRFSRIRTPCKIYFEWHELTARRDPDNVDAGGRKIILDALQKAGKLENDNWKHVRGGGWDMVVDRKAKDYFVIVTVFEVDDFEHI